MIRLRVGLSMAVLMSCMAGPELEMPPTSKIEALGAYRVQGDRLILSGAPGNHHYCIGDSLRQEIQTGADTLGFSLHGDSLTVYLDKQFTDAGSQIQNSRLLIRSTGSVGGLVGSWRSVEPGYRVISGNPTPAESTLLNRGLDLSRRESAFMTLTWEISPDSITVIEDVDWAYLFLARWNGDIDGGANFADSTVFDIAVSVTSKVTVRMVGRQSREVVWLTGWPNGDRDYRSGVANHAEFRYFSSPRGCPAPLEPSWYTDFLAANRKIVNIPPL